MRNRLLILLVILVFHSLKSIAQETNVNVPLTTVLSQLEEHFEIQFNYASKLVDNVEVPQPDASLDLSESLARLKQTTDLDFVLLTKTVVSIRKKNKILCGYLKDKDSGEPLPYVTVQNGSIGTIADEKGFFEIEIQDADDIIQVRHIGHKPIRRAAKYFNPTECGSLYLIPNHEQLAEVVLYDFLIRGIDKLDNGSFQIDLNRLGILPGLIDEDVLHAVQSFPGIQSLDETVSNINIRGGSNDQNLITWDGIKMYQSGHFFGLISMYNPHITQKVELRKNGSSAADTDGVSGTIAMKTDSYLNENLNGSIGINLLDANGFVDTPLGEKVSLQVAARKAISDFVETPTYSEYFDRIKQDTEIEQNDEAVKNSDINFDFYDASFRLRYHPSEYDRIRINFIHTANDLRFNENALLAGREEIRQSNLKQTSIAAGLEYLREWSDNFSTQFSYYETDYQLQATNANVLENQRFFQKNSVSETGVRLKAVQKMHPQFDWMYGYQFTETKVTNLDDVDDPVYFLLEGEVLRAHGIFTEVGLTSKSTDTRLALGMRFNYLEKFNRQLWEPRLSFSHNFWEKFNLEILGEFKHQNTSQVINFQNDFLGIEKRRWQLSNDDDIPVIQGKQLSAGLSYEDNGFLVNAVSFFKKVDGITTQSQGFLDGYALERTTGDYYALGMDLLLRKQLQDYNIWLGYSILDATYRFEALAEPTFPSNFDITHALNLGANYNLNSFLFAAGFNWRTGRPYTPPQIGNEVTNGSINYGDANSSLQDNYMRLDVSAKYEFKWGKTTKAQVGAALWNVLNRNNTINTFYTVDPFGQEQQIQQGSLRMTPNISFRFLFN